MRVRSNEGSNECENNFALAQFSVVQDRITPTSKFNASFERKIERLWFQSRHLGWSYNDFAVHLLEVLVILRCRDTVRLAPAAKQ
jgi:hypothetical protein